MKFLLLTLGLMVAAAVAAPQIKAESPFVFKEHDRVVFLGNTVIEREQHFGFLETALQLGLPDKHITVRNLGWSGDTVFGHARSYFGPPAEGLERLGRHLEQIKPSVLALCYGSDLAFEGLGKLPDFISGYRSLIDLACAKSPNVRIIVIAPPPLENLGAPFPDQTAANENLAAVRDALKELASKHGFYFVDGFALMGGEKQDKTKAALTDNGLHYGEQGYKQWAGKVVEALGVARSDLSTPEATALRDTIIKKDFLFFNRWRPANETYLFGFRKHEQGQNAKEMEELDPLVEAQEKKIAELRESAQAKKLP